jgi:hypothetical protein
MIDLPFVPCPRMKDGQWHLHRQCDLCEGRGWVASLCDKDGKLIDEEGERLNRQAAGEPQ